MRTPKCPKCSQTMDEGYILDKARDGSKASEWIEGPPEWSFWTGLKLGNRDRRQVTTFCCPKCGFLESYAQRPEAPDDAGI